MSALQPFAEYDNTEQTGVNESTAATSTAANSRKKSGAQPKKSVALTPTQSAEIEFYQIASDEQVSAYIDYVNATANTKAAARAKFLRVSDAQTAALFFKLCQAEAPTQATAGMGRQAAKTASTNSGLGVFDNSFGQSFEQHDVDGDVAFDYGDYEDHVDEESEEDDNEPRTTSLKRNKQGLFESPSTNLTEAIALDAGKWPSFLKDEADVQKLRNFLDNLENRAIRDSKKKNGPQEHERIAMRHYIDLTVDLADTMVRNPMLKEVASFMNAIHRANVLVLSQATHFRGGNTAPFQQVAKMGPQWMRILELECAKKDVSTALSRAQVSKALSGGAAKRSRSDSRTNVPTPRQGNGQKPKGKTRKRHF